MSKAADLKKWAEAALAKAEALLEGALPQSEQHFFAHTSVTLANVALKHLETLESDESERKVRNLILDAEAYLANVAS